MKLLLPAAALLLMASCASTDKKENTTGNEDTAVLLTRDKTVDNDDQPGETGSASDDANWNDIDFTGAPAVKYSEITDRDIEVRGNESYGIYGLGENVLFNTGESTLRSDAEGRLRSIAASINQRYGGGRVKIYGFTDAEGSDAANMQLSQARAAAVKTWLQSNGNIAADRLSVHAKGESGPVASNATDAGKQQNRRVQIVAKRGS